MVKKETFGNQTSNTTTRKLKEIGDSKEERRKDATSEK